MTRDDIIRMATEAGITPWVQHQWVGGNKFVDADEGMDGDLACLMQFAALVAAAEREACAKVCDFEVARLSAIDEPRPALAVGICAAAIRARGNT